MSGTMHLRQGATTTRFQEFLNRKYFGPLDGLRALSVGAVIWHHTAGAEMGGVLGRGDLGVDLFFAISGFLITTLLLREYSMTGRIDLPRFYLRRTLRIFPLYYAVLAAYVLLTLTLQRNTPEGQGFIHNLPAFLTYTSNWFVPDETATFFLAWSLATEEQFYIFWPLLLAAVMFLMRGRTLVAGLILAALMFADAVGTVADGDSLAIRILTSIATPICVGALLALALNTRQGFRFIGKILAWQYAGMVLLAVVLVLASAGVHRILIGAVMAFAVAAFCATEDQILTPMLESWPLVFIGGISYGMYLLHVLVMNAVERATHMMDGPLLFALTFAVTTAVAWVSSRYFETPIRNLARKPQSAGRSSASKSM